MTTSARLAALIASAALLLILAATVFLESGRIPILQVLRANVPQIAIALLPLLVVLWRLRHGPDAVGFAIGITFPACVFALVALYMLKLYNGNYDEQKEFFLIIMLFWSAWTSALFVMVFLPALGWLLVSSARAYWALAPAAGMGLLGIVVAAVLLGVVVPLKLWRPAASPELVVYQDHQSQFVFGTLYPCLWSVAARGRSAGFPETLADLWEVGGTDGICAGRRRLLENQTHTIEYRGGKGGFLLSVTERSRTGAPSTRQWTDETGIVRQTLLDPKGKEVEAERRILTIPPLLNLFLVSELNERHARAHPETGYPKQITDDDLDAARARHELTLPDAFRSCARSAPGTSCLLIGGRALVYTPVIGGDGRSTAYTIDVLPAKRFERFEVCELQDLRSYFRDKAGVVHGTGAPRPAKADDPVIPEDERASAAEYAAHWVKGRLMDLEVEARYRLARDSLRRETHR